MANNRNTNSNTSNQCHTASFSQNVPMAIVSPQNSIMVNSSQGNEPTTPTIQRRIQEKAVCRFDFVDPDFNAFFYLNKGCGTGFHIRGGWVITNSHVIGQNGVNLPRMRITFDNVASPIIFQPRGRPCFFQAIDHKQDRSVDLKNPDVALVYLGWEDEAFGLPAMNTWFPATGASPKKGDRTYCLHYGWRHGQRPGSIIYSLNEEVTNVIDSKTTITVCRKTEIHVPDLLDRRYSANEMVRLWVYTLAITLLCASILTGQ